MSLMLRRVRLVSLDGQEVPDRPVDLRVENGVVAEIGMHLQHPVGMPEYDAAGRWVMPGLWDQHVHLGQWTLASQRLDLSGTGSAPEVIGRVAARIAQAPDEALVAWGHRPAGWDRPVTVADLDAIVGDRIAVLISGDAHHAVMSSAAMHALGLPLRPGPVEENEWFATYPRLTKLVGSQATPAAYAAVMAQAAAAGIVGLVDLEFDQGVGEWGERAAAGVNSLHVRVGAYPDTFDQFVAAGLHTGSVMPGCDERITAGPLKVISDGSLNTRTAHCRGHYPDGSHGGSNLTPGELADLMRAATQQDFDVAAHAIGDAAVGRALDAFEATGAVGSIEHVQLIERHDAERMGQLPLRASVQPAHLLDDRDLTEALWSGASAQSFALRWLMDAGVPLALGSDAPVSPLDPWLAMAAAVHRSADERPAWHPEQALTAREALAASTNGAGTLAAASPGDLIVLDRDPLGALPDHPGLTEAAARADWLLQTSVDLTVVHGRLVHHTF